MNLKFSVIAILLAFSINAFGQVSNDINQVDESGRKQGHWIKLYPNNSKLYDGYFKDNHPVGEFKRYNDDNTLKSILIYSDDGTEALATIYYPSGEISSKGKYINQMKEGEWEFYSQYTPGYLISKENYSRNLRNGLSLKFYPDSTIAEKLTYVKDIKQGEWIQYYPDGKICLKSNFNNGLIDGKFEVWFENSQIQFSGYYKNDARDGLWSIYNDDGTLKYQLEYESGISKNKEMEIDESEYFDMLDENKSKIADPEKTGIIR